MTRKELWRVDKNSADWNMLNGWISRFFKEWLEQTSQKYNVSVEDVIVGVAETIRKISFQTLEILNGNSEKVEIPPFIITENITGYLAALGMMIESGEKAEIFCFKKKSLEKLSPLELIFMEMQGLFESSRVIFDGRRVTGGANKYATAYYCFAVSGGFDFILCANNSKLNRCEALINVVVEETLHYFDYKTNPSLVKELEEEKLKIESFAGDYAKKEDLGQELEDRLGIKKRVLAIFDVLKIQKEDLFAPFKERFNNSL